MVDTAPAAPSAAAPGGPASPPAADAVIQSQRAPLRAEALRGLAALNAGAKQDASPATASTTPAAGAAPVAGDPPSAEPALEAPPADTAAAKPPEEAPVEPPGMAAVRKAEQHARRQLAEERAKLAAEYDTKTAAWKAKVERADAIDAAAAAARRDPIGALRALGFTDEDFEPLGRTLYGASPAGLKDPRYKATGEAALREREQMTAVQRLEAEVRSLRQEREQERTQAETQSRVDAYVDGVVRAIGDATPIARSAFQKNPTRVREALTAVADRLYVESGPSHDLRDVPTAAQVLTAYEAERIAELELYGVDPSTLTRPAPKAPAPPVAKPAATLAPSGGAGPTVQATGAKPTREEALAVLRKIREGGAS